MPSLIESEESDADSDDWEAPEIPAYLQTVVQPQKVSQQESVPSFFGNSMESKDGSIKSTDAAFAKKSLNSSFSATNKSKLLETGSHHSARTISQVKKTHKKKSFFDDN